MGGVVGLDYSALPFLLRVYNVPEPEWEIYLDKIKEIVTIGLRHWNRDTKKD